MSPRNFVCEYCGAVAKGEAPPADWKRSFFADCGGGPLRYCPAPACQAAEDLSVAVHKQAWEAPKANARHDTWDGWMAALLPLARHEGYLGAEEGPEGLDPAVREFLREQFDCGETPAAALRADMSEAC
jgi:hypothetical protein